MDRPDLDKNISLEDFKDYYWLKEELVIFCKQIGIDHTGGKIEISERIELFISTGCISGKGNNRIEKKKSDFDWNREPLSLSTIITDNYKNTQNVREFFSKEIGKNFSFNVNFMNWMKNNTGKTLKDAIIEWERINNLKKENKTEIAAQFEYNKYIRDFMTDNPDKTIKDAIKYWKLKRAERGSNMYKRSDLDLK